MRLPVAGFRSSADATIVNPGGISGFYQTSNVNLSNSSYLAINGSLAGVYDLERAAGMCVRCIKEANASLIESNQPSFSVYPNPATNNVTIESNSAIISIQIVDLTGAIVQIETQNTFSIEHLTNGVYLMSIKTDDGTVTKRLIKE